MSRDDVVDTEGSFDLFCYGTLLVPAILLRVLGHTGEGLKFYDALLNDYTRHHVKGEDYPAIIDQEQLAKLIGPEALSELSSAERSTRGTLISGLTFKDMRSLDVFEGDQYVRSSVTVSTFGEARSASELTTSITSSACRGDAQVTGQITALTYIWTAPIEDLEAGLWSIDDFLKDKAAVWTSLDTKEFDDVDKHHAVKSIEGSELVGQKVEGFPDFGHNMLKYWGFADTYINLNHGSYGSPPTPVIESMRKESAEIEARPDLYMRRTVAVKLTEVRKKVAAIVGVETEELVIVPNATHGINTVVSNLEWNNGDIIVVYATTYNAVSSTMKYLCDRHPNIRLEFIQVTFPCTHDEVVDATEAVLSKYNRIADAGVGQAVGVTTSERVRLVVVDGIASVPGVIYPWERIVGLSKKYGALSLVDAAHSIGQHKIDVKGADPDFWISNCHKWLMSHRGSAVMYVPYRNQSLIRSSFPTGHFYESARYPTPEGGHPWVFAEQYDWNGTIDWAPFMSIGFAIDFRESIGGEDRIINYCHSLAVAGGKRLAKRWGTQIMENEEGSLTACMVNVALPDFPVPQNAADGAKQLKYIENSLFKSDCFAPPYFHNGRWWTRISAQVWVELGDFDLVGDVYDKIGEGLRTGAYLQ